MLSVLKQEFFIHKKNIFLTSMILLALYIGCGIFYGLNQVFESDGLADLTAMWFGFSMAIGSIGVFFIALPPPSWVRRTSWDGRSGPAAPRSSSSPEWRS